MCRFFLQVSSTCQAMCQVELLWPRARWCPSLRRPRDGQTGILSFCRCYSLFSFFPFVILWSKDRWVATCYQSSRLHHHDLHGSTTFHNFQQLSTTTSTVLQTGNTSTHRDTSNQWGGWLWPEAASREVSSAESLWQALIAQLSKQIYYNSNNDVIRYCT